MAVACPHLPPCPGCPRFGAGGIAPEALARLRALAADAGLPPPGVVEGPAFGWRHRARLAVRGRATSPKIGVFAEGSHRIVDIPGCLVHHPAINRIAGALRDAIRDTGTPPYADERHRGVLRYVQIVVERATERAQVVLVANGDGAHDVAPLAGALATRAGDGLHSLWWNGNPARTNTILGRRWHRIAGGEAVREEIGGAAVFFPPGAFGQANLPLADRLVAQVAAWVPDGARVVELYAGVGAIGLGLVRRAAAVAFNERAQDGLAGLRLGLAALAPDVASRATVVPGPAAAVDGLDAADVVVADPPRKGLDPEVLARLLARPPSRLVLVSCSVGAFLREAAALRPVLPLRALVPYALFPHTAHVETVALFARDGA